MLNFWIKSRSSNIDKHAFKVSRSSRVFSSKWNESKPITWGSGICCSFYLILKDLLWKYFDFEKSKSEILLRDDSLPLDLKTNDMKERQVLLVAYS